MVRYHRGFLKSRPLGKADFQELRYFSVIEHCISVDYLQ